MLALDIGLQQFEVIGLRAGGVIEQRLFDIEALVEHRQRRFDLAHGGGDGRAFGFLLRALTIEHGELGVLLRGLVDQELALGCNQRRRRAIRRPEIRQRIAIRQLGLQSRDVELRGHQVAFEMVGLGLVHGRIERDQNVARLHHLAVVDVDGSHDAGFERLDHLGAAGRNDLPGRRSDDIDLTEKRPSQGKAEQANDAQRDHAARRRRRRLDDFQSGRQEGELVLVPARVFPREGKHVLQ